MFALTHVIEFSLVAEQRVISAVFALAVFCGDEAASLLAAAVQVQGLAGRDVRRPKLIGSFVSESEEQLGHEERTDEDERKDVKNHRTIT